MSICSSSLSRIPSDLGSSTFSFISINASKAVSSFSLLAYKASKTLFILLSISVLGMFGLGNAQSVVFEENFDAIEELPLGWENIDADGDGFTWNIVQIQGEDGPVFTPLLRSASWATSALTPDNWVITPMIDLSNASGTVTLNYDIGSVDADWDAENYTVYVHTSNVPEEMLNAEITFNESTLDGVNEPTPRSIDISALAGQMIYVAFRHHDVSDQFTIELDNIQVVADNLSVSDINGAKKSSLIYPNPVNELVNIRLSDSLDAAKTSVKITNIIGEIVAEYNYNNVLNLSKLPAGVYIMTLTDGNITEAKKLIKK